MEESTAERIKEGEEWRKERTNKEIKEGWHKRRKESKLMGRRKNISKEKRPKVEEKKEWK